MRKYFDILDAEASVVCRWKGKGQRVRVEVVWFQRWPGLQADTSSEETRVKTCSQLSTGQADRRHLPDGKDQYEMRDREKRGKVEREGWNDIDVSTLEEVANASFGRCV